MEQRSPDISAEFEQDPRYRTDYERLLPEIRRVRSNELVPIDIDIQQAVVHALNAWPHIRAYRANVVAQMPLFDIARFDDYEAYARALGRAHAHYMAAVAPSGNLPPLAQKALVLRDQLLSDASALARRGLVRGERLKGLKGPAGFRHVAHDLLVLATLVRESWSRIATKTAVELTELDDADYLAARLLTEVDLRVQVPSLVAQTGRIRQQAFSLFIYVHDQVKRALSFVRWNEGDVDDIVPLLYARISHGSRNRVSLRPAPTNGADRTETTPADPDATDTLLSIPLTNDLRSRWRSHPDSASV